MDYLYLVADVYLKSGRLIHSIVDRTLLLVGMTDRIDRYKGYLSYLAKVPGLGSIAYLMCCSAPSREQTKALLGRGNIVGVAPGGGRQVGKNRISFLDFGH